MCGTSINNITQNYDTYECFANFCLSDLRLKNKERKKDSIKKYG